jgi:transposase-like protein
MVVNVPPEEALTAIFHNNDAAIAFSRENGLVDIHRSCPTCGGTIADHGILFKCTKNGCRKQISLFANSFFSRLKTPLCKVLQVGYLWLIKCPSGGIAAYTGVHKQTTADLLLYYRQLVASSLNEEDTRIGGEGVVVELDESKFGKRKYHRGHRVEGVWVFGGVERSEEKRSFVRVVENRSADTLLNVIAHHILPGSIVYTDMWKAYDGIEDKLGLSHFTVNHSVEFKNSITGVHTNTIEGYWNGIKLCLAPRNRTKDAIGPHLHEHIWRRKNRGCEWSGLLEAFRVVSFEN